MWNLFHFQKEKIKSVCFEGWNPLMIQKHIRLKTEEITWWKEFKSPEYDIMRQMLVYLNNTKAQNMTSCGGTSKETVLRSTFLNILLNMLLYNTKWCYHKDPFWMCIEALNFIVFFFLLILHSTSAYLFSVPTCKCQCKEWQRICQGPWLLLHTMTDEGRHSEQDRRAGDEKGKVIFRKGKWWWERESDF